MKDGELQGNHIENTAIPSGASATWTARDTPAESLIALSILHPRIREEYTPTTTGAP